MDPTPAAAPDISIIVPALNEAANLPTLLDRIAQSMGPRHYEVLIVDDDSKDDTPAVCARLAERFPLRLIVRKAARDGLGGAVLRGFAESRGESLVVMDADLQHPPEVIPQLLDQLNHGAEFALGSRYVAGGSTASKWTLFRRLNSRAATLLARPFAGPVADPMSGFFALRRSTFNRGTRLAPLGYKIGLELMCKCRVASVTEVPIHFAARAHGHSKLTLAEQFRYLEHLSRLYDFTYPRLAAYAKFTIVVALAWACGWAVTKLLLETRLTTSPAAAITFSYPMNILITAAFHARYVRVQRQFLVVDRPWAAFWLTSLTEWAACAAVAFWLWHRLHHPTLPEVFLPAYAATVLVRYIMRKELGQDLRGLRRELRREEVFAD